MNIRSKPNLRMLAACVASAALLISCSKASESSSSLSAYSAYREDAIVLGHVDVSAIRDSAIAESLPDDLPIDNTSNIGISKEDVMSISFSMTLPNPEKGEQGAGSALLLLNQTVTLDQLAEGIDEHNEDQDDEDQVRYTRGTVEGVDVLTVELPVDDNLLPDGVSGTQTVHIATLPSGKQTYVAVASPQQFADLVHKRNPTALPSFAQKGTSKLTNKDQGFLILKITPEMKEGLQEMSRSMQEDPAAMGMPFPPSLANNLPALQYVGLGVSVKKEAVLELQGVFETEAQASGFAAGLTNVIAGLQFALAMAFANSPEEMSVLPTFTQANQANTASIVLTLSKVEE